MLKILGCAMAQHHCRIILLLKLVLLSMTACADYNKCGGRINSNSDSIQYPAKGGIYPSYADCSWVIVTTGTSIELKFTSFHTEEGHDYVEIRDGESRGSRSLVKYSGYYYYTLPLIVRTTTNKAFIRFNSDHNRQFSGFVLTWNAIMQECECGGEYNTESGTICLPITSNGYYSSNQECSWIINLDVPLDITFSSFNTERDYDILTVQDGGNAGITGLRKLSGNTLPATLKTAKGANIQFTSDWRKVDTGFVLHWKITSSESSSKCGKHINRDSRRIQYPVSGSKYPVNDYCSWVIESTEDTIELNFTSFETESGYDFVYIRDGGNSSSPLLGIYSGYNLPLSMRTKTNKAFIGFSSDSSKQYKGFSLTWDTVDFEDSFDCGYQINRDSGSLQYPLRGGDYLDKVECVWVIVSSGASIELKITRLSTEKYYDFVYIRDGDSSSSRQLGKFSGNVLPSIVRTTKDKAFIRFTSDRAKAGEGFAVTWNTIDNHCECSGTYSTASGTICLPLTSAGKYKSNQNCIWTINSTVPLDISFSSFKTERRYDVLIVRNGTSVGSALIGNFSGSALPETLKTTGDVYIQFISDSRIGGTGFVLHWNSSYSSPTTPKSDDSSATGTSTYIILGAVAAVVIAVLVTSILFWLQKRKSKDEQELYLVDVPHHQSDPGMGKRHDSENSLYGATPGATEPRVPNHRSRHDSENSLYGATVARDA